MRLSHLWLLAMAVGLAACNTAPNTPTPLPPTSTVPPALLLTISTTGGLCPYGLCHSEFTLDVAGRYTWHAGEATPQAGQATPEEVAALQAEMAAADFNALQSQPFTGECPTAVDGSEVTYFFYTAQSVEVLAACTVVIDTTHPLIQLADTLWQKALSPAPADSP